MMKLLSREEKAALFDEAVERIKAGEVISIHDASGSAIAVCIGDFRAMGWAEKNVWRTGMNWTWKGPTAIMLSGERVEPGKETVEVDMDWS